MKLAFLIFLSSIYSTHLFCNEQKDNLSLVGLRTKIAKVIEEKKVPAVAIAMVNKEGPVWIETFGKANLEKDILADNDTLFRIGSTTKMFVALSVLKLVEEGKLSLDDKIADLVPDLKYENSWEKTAPIRVVHLLEHTTGWDDFHFVEYAHSDPTPISLKEGLDFHPHSRTSRWKPGTRMSYCNSGPPAAAYIVEKITGQDFEEYVKENFFDPMGMETITFRLSEDVKAKGATLYSKSIEAQEYWHVLMRPAGSVNASLKDMTKFISFFLNRGLINEKQLISNASLSRMESVKSTTAAKAGQEDGYGLHNYAKPFKNWVYRGHDGGVNGGKAEFSYLPEEGLGHVILINTDDHTAFKEISDLVCEYETQNLRINEVAQEQGATSGKHIAGFYYPINPRQQSIGFFERLFAIQKLSFDGEKLIKKGVFFGEPSIYLPFSKNLFKCENTGLISLSHVNDPLEGDVVHVGSTVLKSTNLIGAYCPIIIAYLWQFLIVVSVLFAPVWIVRKKRGKIPNKASIRVRLWPLMTGLFAIIAVGFFTIGTLNPIKYLGTPSWVSIGIMISTIVFGIFAVAGIYPLIKERKTKMNRVNYWFSTLTSCTHLTVALYLLYCGFIGIMTWG